MPDRDSSPDTLGLSQAVSTHVGFDSALEPITPILETVGCYSRQEEAIREVVPEYGPGWKSKLVLESVLGNKGYNFFHIVVEAPDGTRIARRASPGPRRWRKTPNAGCSGVFRRGGLRPR